MANTGGKDKDGSSGSKRPFDDDAVTQPPQPDRRRSGRKKQPLISFTTAANDELGMGHLTRQFDGNGRFAGMGEEGVGEEVGEEDDFDIGNLKDDEDSNEDDNAAAAGTGNLKADNSNDDSVVANAKEDEDSDSDVSVSKFKFSGKMRDGTKGAAKKEGESYRSIMSFLTYLLLILILFIHYGIQICLLVFTMSSWLSFIIGHSLVLTAIFPQKI